MQFRLSLCYCACSDRPPTEEARGEANFLSWREGMQNCIAKLHPLSPRRHLPLGRERASHAWEKEEEEAAVACAGKEGGGGGSLEKKAGSNLSSATVCGGDDKLQRGAGVGAGSTASSRSSFCAAWVRAPQRAPGHRRGGDIDGVCGGLNGVGRRRQAAWEASVQVPWRAPGRRGSGAPCVAATYVAVRRSGWLVVGLCSDAEERSKGIELHPLRICRLLHCSPEVTAPRPGSCSPEAAPSPAGVRASTRGRMSAGGAKAERAEESRPEEQRQSSKRDGGEGNFVFACCCWRDRKMA
jgi:hypothetical protein